ncbi:MAG TPA: ABC transporter ATP-binding protein [Candidatus Dormibacteraeota bacterium]|nr:ABC transporter ATP-binding protein [Candidatus Dormibacteraeota bacterium]
MEAVLETHALSKSYGSRVAVRSLDLVVGRGEIFGFLGPNGAGKTTTIRMALGLIRPTAGSVSIFGEDLHSRPQRVLPRVGALVESPALYLYMSGRDNLQAVADVLGGVARGRIDEVLGLVGLAERQRDLVRRYSLGMKQRLGLAMALLADPELLILDEPANGLDPAGVVEMRDLLRRLAAEGKTIFISSHVLAEVQQLCTRVAIINLGQLVKVAAVADLVASHGEFQVGIEDSAAVLELLHRQDWGAAARIEDGLVITLSPTGRGRDLTRFLAAAGYWPDSVGERRVDLEDIFLSLTGAETEA